MIRRIPIVVAVVAMVLVSMPAASAEAEESGPDSFDPVPMAVQTAAGTGVVSASFVGADRVFSHAGFSSTSVGLAMGLVLSTPLTVPLAVNATGSAMGYDSQWVGSHLGGLIGGLGTGAGILGIGTAVSDQPYQYFLGWSLFGMGAGAVVGSVLGFHLRAGSGDESAERAMAAPTVSPVYDQTSDDWGVTAGVQGRF